MGEQKDQVALHRLFPLLHVAQVVAIPPRSPSLVLAHSQNHCIHLTMQSSGVEMPSLSPLVSSRHPKDVVHPSGHWC